MIYHSYDNLTKSQMPEFLKFLITLEDSTRGLILITVIVQISNTIFFKIINGMFFKIDQFNL